MAKRYNAWTPKEDAQLLRMKRMGRATKYISSVLGRSADSIAWRLKQLGYTPVDSEKEHLTNDRCRKCYYGSMAGSFNMPTCDYILITGKKRPCHGGEECTVFREGRRTSRERIAEDIRQEMELYHAKRDGEL